MMLIPSDYTQLVECQHQMSSQSRTKETNHPRIRLGNRPNDFLSICRFQKLELWEINTAKRMVVCRDPKISQRNIGQHRG